MSENTTAITIGIVAIITALGSAGALLFKYIRKSDCLGVHIETRTPNLSKSSNFETVHDEKHNDTHNDTHDEKVNEKDSENLKESNV